jgi:hypothetical protein
MLGILRSRNVLARGGVQWFDARIVILEIILRDFWEIFCVVLPQINRRPNQFVLENARGFAQPSHLDRGCTSS